MHAVTDFRDLAEQHGAAALDDHIRRVARAGVGGYAGEGVAAAALHADEQIAEGQLLALALIEDFKLFFRHLQDGLHAALKAVALLEHHHVFGGVVFRAHQHVRRQLFTAQGNHHELAAEIGMMADVAQGADGHLGLGGVDGHAAAIGVIDGHHVVHVGILGQKLPADAVDGHVQRAFHALHGGLDAQEIAGARRAALGVAVSPPGFHRGLGQIGADIGAIGHIVQGRRGGQAQHVLVDPLALGDGIQGIAQHHAVADDLAILGNIAQGDFMGLGNIGKGHHAGHDLGALGQFVHGDGHVILRLDLYVCTHKNSLKAGWRMPTGHILLGNYRTRQGFLLSNFQPGIRYCMPLASSRAPRQYSL